MKSLTRAASATLFSALMVLLPVSAHAARAAKTDITVQTHTQRYHDRTPRVHSESHSHHYPKAPVA